MAAMRTLCILVLLAALMSGCSDGARDAADAAEPEAPPARLAAGEHVAAYEFTGLVTGASPPDPQAEGGAAEQLPLAKVDTFEAPAGTVRLSYSSDLQGTGSGRVEVYAPDGALAYSSETRMACAVAACLVETTTSSEPAVLPGAYEVRYYVAGALDVEVGVEAFFPSVPASP